MTTLPGPARDECQQRPVTAGQRSSLWRVLSITEVRWAAAAAMLFAIGGAVQLGGAPAPVWWTLY
ncbi:MAG: hypothetical protein M3256_20115, partial [Actinomycetota bacterium]|nr:hypothetical protein [Actinomycetota bacterium]